MLTLSSGVCKNDSRKKEAVSSACRGKGRRGSGGGGVLRVVGGGGNLQPAPRLLDSTRSEDKAQHNVFFTFSLLEDLRRAAAGWWERHHTLGGSLSGIRLEGISFGGVGKFQVLSSPPTSCLKARPAGRPSRSPRRMRRRPAAMPAGQKQHGLLRLFLLGSSFTLATSAASLHPATCASLTVGGKTLQALEESSVLAVHVESRQVLEGSRLASAGERSPRLALSIVPIAPVNRPVKAAGSSPQRMRCLLSLRALFC